MTLFDLTWRNVRRNFRLYTIYLVSMIVSVMIYFTFNSLMYNEDVINALENKDNFTLGLNIASFAILLFIALCVLYANSFFLRQRKKEFGMYLMFGIEKGKLGRMIFYENLLIGLLSLAIGIVLGGILSKFFAMILMKLMKYDEIISIVFPLKAIGQSTAVFLAMAVLLSLQGYWVVNRVQLIELFQARQKQEKPLKSSSWLAMLCVVLLASAYFTISRGIGSTIWKEHALIGMLLVAVGLLGGTFLFFRQFTGWMLKRLRHRKGYYEGDGMLWVSPLQFQVRGNSLNLTFIALFSMLIIFFVAFVALNYRVQFEAVGRNLPNSIAYSAVDVPVQKEIDALIEESRHGVINEEKVSLLPAVPVTDMDLAFENLGYFTPTVLLVGQSDYNRIVKLRKNDKQLVSLTKNEAVSLSQGTDFPEKYKTPREFTIKLNEEVKLDLIEKKDYAYLGWSTDPVKSMGKKPTLFVISDELLANLSSKTDQQDFVVYQLKDEGNAEQLSKDVHKLLMKEKAPYYSSFADVYSKQIESSAFLLFSSSFLALIALFALASVIYFKQLREAMEERNRYIILTKLGITDAELKRGIRKQLLFVFIPPLLLAIGHSMMTIKYYILDSVADFQLGGLVWSVVALFTLIYALFYLSSVNVYYRIAKGDL